MTIALIKAGIQILLLTYFVYFFYQTLADSEAVVIFKFFLMYLIFYFSFSALNLFVLRRIAEALVLPFVTLFAVMYGAELRRAVSSRFSRRNGVFKRSSDKINGEIIDNILSACQNLVRKKRGALIIFPRETTIEDKINGGTRLNAEVTDKIISTVFEFDTALHDGAMVIQGNRVIEAGCYLPLTTRVDINPVFGTRHRAALGIAERSDAVVLVVSEESGAMSLAYDGQIYYKLSQEQIRGILLSLFNNSELKQDISDSIIDSQAG